MAVSGTLVIGFGNTIRTDDSAGIWIAEQLAALQLSGVVVDIRHQLSLDLLDEFDSFTRLLFIDASVDGEPFRFEKLGNAGVTVPPSAHHLRPEDLLGMYAQLYGKEVAAFFCTIRGENFEFGTELTPSVRVRAEKAVLILADFLQSTEE